MADPPIAPIPDDIFYLPEGIFGEGPELDARVDPVARGQQELARRLRDTYEVVVDRMRREAGRALSTIEMLLLERIAFNYVAMRAKEAASGTDRGFAHATAQKDYNTFWLSLVQEFHKQTKSTDSAFRDQLVQYVGRLLNEMLDKVPDEELKSQLRQGVHEGLAEAGY